MTAQRRKPAAPAKKQEGGADVADDNNSAEDLPDGAVDLAKVAEDYQSSQDQADDPRVGYVHVARGQIGRRVFETRDEAFEDAAVTAPGARAFLLPVILPAEDG